MNLDQTLSADINHAGNNGPHPNGSGVMPAPRKQASEVPPRCYPSLCDDGQPWFPFRGDKSDPADACSGASEASERRMGCVRLIAILAIVMLVAIFAAGR